MTDFLSGPLFVTIAAILALAIACIFGAAVALLKATARIAPRRHPIGRP